MSGMARRGHLGPTTGPVLILIKIYVFCSKCYIRIDKCMFIVIKIKCVNSDRINDICNKINFTTNYTYFTILDIHSKHTQHFIKIYTNIIIFNTFDETVPQQDL
jgi:hypothetical protein